MVLLHSPKEGEPGIREMQSVVQPLFGDITFDDACKQYGHGVNGKESTDRPCEEKQRQNVLPFPADMFSIERPQGMIPVKGIGPYLQESQDHAVAPEEIGGAEQNGERGTRCKSRSGSLPRRRPRWSRGGLPRTLSSP